MTARRVALGGGEAAAAKADAVQRLGAWTAHSIHLGGDVYTMDAPQNDPRARRVVQVAADITGKPWGELRVLDLACLEGQFGIKFAQHGAKVFGIEARQQTVLSSPITDATPEIDRPERPEYMDAFNNA